MTKMKKTEKVELYSQLNDTPYSFSLKIEDLVRDNNCSYMEAILKYCLDKDLDEQAIQALITPVIKDKLEKEAKALKLLKKEVNESESLL